MLKKLARIFFYSVMIFSVGVLISSCGKESIFTGEKVNLSFSLDTLRFDTVFTTQGSATRFVKVFNHEDETIILDKVYMEQRSNSFFRLNVDGTPTDEAEGIEIAANDSIYVFVEVTIDPDLPLSASPFVIEDYLTIEYKSQTESVLFEAWGQNANYITGRSAAGDINPRLLSCNLGQIVFDDPKPYIIHGQLIIDSCEIIIPEGTNIYIHGGFIFNEGSVFNDGIIVCLKDGKLNCQGTADNPVVFQGDRLEENFQDTPGQWVGIRFFNESRGNVLNHTIIKNSIIGLRADSLAEVTISDSRFINTSSAGVIGVHAEISMDNCEFYNNATNGVQLGFGGKYTMNHCTIYNSNNQDPGLVATNFACQDIDCLLPLLINSLELSFQNTIISGTNDDEILFIDATEGVEEDFWQVSFSHSLLRVEDILEEELYQDLFTSCNTCLLTSDTDSLFLDRDAFDLRLDTMSRAIDKGIISPLISDILGQNRDNQPDLGAYEFIP